MRVVPGSALHLHNPEILTTLVKAMKCAVIFILSLHCGAQYEARNIASHVSSRLYRYVTPSLHDDVNRGSPSSALPGWPIAIKTMLFS